MIFTKRSLAFIALAYFLTFIFGIIFSIAFGFNPENDPSLIANPPLLFCLATIVGSTLVSALVTYLFFTFRKPNLKASTKNGFRFGLTMVVLSFGLDLILFLPLVLSTGQIEYLIGYYGKWYFYVAVAGVLAGATGMGYWLARRTKKS